MPCHHDPVDEPIGEPMIDEQRRHRRAAGRIAAGLAGLVALAAIAACGSSGTVDTSPATTARPSVTDDTKARPAVTTPVGTAPRIGTTATTCVSAPASTAVGMPGGGEIVCSTNDTTPGPANTATTIPHGSLTTTTTR